jgi:hypothetical protein
MHQPRSIEKIATAHMRLAMTRSGCCRSRYKHKGEAMETLDYQVMDSILVATLFIVFLMVLFGLYGLYKKVREMERKLSFMEATLADLGDAVKNIPVSPNGYNKIIMLKQDDLKQ